eukprot:scaffold125417_cov51-Phaeocystis_antarctica.AAC.1
MWRREQRERAVRRPALNGLAGHAPSPRITRRLQRAAPRRNVELDRGVLRGRDSRRPGRRHGQQRGRRRERRRRPHRR